MLGAPVDFFSISSDILADYRVTGRTGRFGGLEFEEFLAWGILEGLGGFWGFPALGRLPELGEGETLGVLRFGEAWGPWDLADPRTGGTGRFGVVGEYQQLNQHLSQSILHCTSRGLSKGRKDGKAGKSFFWEGRAELG